MSPICQERGGATHRLPFSKKKKDFLKCKYCTIVTSFFRLEKTATGMKERDARMASSPSSLIIPSQVLLGAVAVNFNRSFRPLDPTGPLSGQIIKMAGILPDSSSANRRNWVTGPPSVAFTQPLRRSAAPPVLLRFRSPSSLNKRTICWMDRLL